MHCVGRLLVDRVELSDVTTAAGLRLDSMGAHPALGVALTDVGRRSRGPPVRKLGKTVASRKRANA